MPISKFLKIRLSVAWIKYFISKLVGFRWRVQEKKKKKKNTVILEKIKTSIVQLIIVRDYWDLYWRANVLAKFERNSAFTIVLPNLFH